MQTMKRTTIGVLTFPGSNCDRDVLSVFRDFYQAECDIIWHADSFDKKYDLLIVPGGFSYGDYLRCGAIARFARAMESLNEHVKSGRAALGICNGFQILCEARLLPGALIQNTNLRHICRDVPLKANPSNPVTGSVSECSIPVSHSEGNYRISPEGLQEIQDNNQIAFYYCENINGSVNNIAGITDKNHKVLGMMPHPERAADPFNGSIQGRAILQAIIDTLI